jgi:hypothetical protein
MRANTAGATRPIVTSSAAAITSGAWLPDITFGKIDRICGKLPTVVFRQSGIVRAARLERAVAYPDP